MAALHTKLVAALAVGMMLLEGQSCIYQVGTGGEYKQLFSDVYVVATSAEGSIVGTTPMCASVSGRILN